MNSTEKVDDAVKQLKNNLKDMIVQYFDSHEYSSAVFWADKLFTISRSLESAYLYAKSLFLDGQFRRASHFLTSRNLEKVDLSFKILSARCLFMTKDYAEALMIIESNNDEGNTNSNSHSESAKNTARPVSPQAVNVGVSDAALEGSLHLLRGKLYEALENRVIATQCYKEAISVDHMNFEAFSLLTRHNLMTKQDAVELLETVEYQGSHIGDVLLKFLYSGKLGKNVETVNLIDLPPALKDIYVNPDVLSDLAAQYLENCSFQDCLTLTNSILLIEPCHTNCLPIHIACLTELRKVNELFGLGHKLVDDHPQWATSWFAVGCYYFVVLKHELARKYLNKSITLDPSFGSAWLTYGHSFAQDGEHDQALTAYYNASKLMRGCHLPLFYIGIEHSITNNVKLAEQFFNEALELSPRNPWILHEMGISAMHRKKLEEAEQLFKDSLKEVQQACLHETLPSKWEPLYNNLGHVCRQLGKFEDALTYHKKALLSLPKNPGTMSAIGFVYALMGNNLKAIHYFHKCLSLKRDDTFSITMLANVLQALSMEKSDIKPVLPDFSDDILILPINSGISTVNSSISKDDDISLMDNSCEFTGGGIFDRAGDCFNKLDVTDVSMEMSDI